MISLIIPIDNNSKNIEIALTNIFNQTNKNFNLYILDASTSDEIKQKINKFNFNALQNITYTLVNNISSFHSFYVEIIKTINDKYVYFANNNSIISTNFVELISKVSNSDILVLGNVKNSITVKRDDFKKIEEFITPLLCDKVFSVSFLKNNEIYFLNNDYVSIIFLYKTISKCNSLSVIKCEIKNIYQDLYIKITDFIQMLNELIANYQESKFWKQNNEWMNLILTFYIFIYIYNIYLYEKKSIKKNINYSYLERYLSKKNPNWRKNKKLEYIDEILDKKVEKFISDFDFSDEMIKKLSLYFK